MYCPLSSIPTNWNETIGTDVGKNDIQVKDTFDLEEARRSYFSSLFPLNPGGIVPSGPTAEDLKLDEDPGRGPKDPSALFYRKPQPALAA